MFSTSEPAAHLKRFQNEEWNTFFVVLVVVIAAYVPVFLDPDLASNPPIRNILLIGLGLVYLIMATYVFSQIDDGKNYTFLIIYFVIQIGLIISIQILGQSVGGGLWLLALPAVAQSLALPPAGMVLVCLALLAGMGGLISSWGAPLSEVFQFIIAISAAMVFTLVFTNIAVRAQQARSEVENLASKLKDANQKLRAYAVQAEELATIQERNRLAREIHDTLGHYLTVINIQLNAAEAVFTKDPERSLAAIQRSKKLTQEGLAEVRQSVAALRSAPTAGQSLPEVLDSLAAEARTAGLVTIISITGQPQPLDPRTELTLYRAVQEGLTNVRKHAHASRVDINVNYEAHNVVSLTVQDNGLGTDQTEGGFGLLGLRERVQLLGGQVDVDTAPGAGFQLSIQVPHSMAEPAQQESSR